jgi:3-phosphoshikimate 1-carboxyvinyltransferase
LRESGLCRGGRGRSEPQSRKLAVELVVDRCEDDLDCCVPGRDVIQLAVPILAMEKVLADWRLIWARRF